MFKMISTLTKNIIIFGEIWVPGLTILLGLRIFAHIFAHICASFAHILPLSQHISPLWSFWLYCSNDQTSDHRHNFGVQ
jgi:hypothetical protein